MAGRCLPHPLRQGARGQPRPTQAGRGAPAVGCAVRSRMRAHAEHRRAHRGGARVAQFTESRPALDVEAGQAVGGLRAETG
eukprot:2501713-Lingulodinium_polyedra.AAC.1